MTIQEIENITFREFILGRIEYKLKHIKDPNPLMNCNGLIMIDSNYYYKDYLTQPLQREFYGRDKTEGNSPIKKQSFWDSILDPFKVKFIL